MTVHPVFHVSLLVPHKPRPADMSTPPDWEPVEEQDGELPTYEVEHILDQKGEGQEARYLVKWKGFPDSAATWEPLSNLTNCARALRHFRKSRNRARRAAANKRCVPINSSNLNA